MIDGIAFTLKRSSVRLFACLDQLEPRTNPQEDVELDKNIRLRIAAYTFSTFSALVLSRIAEESAASGPVLPPATPLIV